MDTNVILKVGTLWPMVLGASVGFLAGLILIELFLL
jgi:hypothetical protein